MLLGAGVTSNPGRPVLSRAGPPGRSVLSPDPILITSHPKA